MLLTSTVYAASISVNSTADNLTAGDGQCTLREAVTNANAGSDTTNGDCTAGTGADTISLDATGPYTLTIPIQLTVSSQMTIQGNGQDRIAE